MKHPMRGHKMSEAGWIYILPECGDARDLIKLGRSVNPKGRADTFWGFVWPRPSDQYPSHFWAAEVGDRQAAERAALQAMAPLRAFEEHPGWPVAPIEPRWPPYDVSTWRLGMPYPWWHPRKAHLWERMPEYSDYQTRHSSYLLQHRRWQAETTRLKLACFSEHFRCDAMLAVEVVSVAIRSQLVAVSYNDR